MDGPPPPAHGKPRCRGADSLCPETDVTCISAPGLLPCAVYRVFQALGCGKTDLIAGSNGDVDLSEGIAAHAFLVVMDAERSELFELHMPACLEVRCHDLDELVEVLVCHCSVNAARFRELSDQF